MRVGAFQFDVRRGAWEANRRAVELGLLRAADTGVELLGLPEMWPTSFVAEGDPEGWLRQSEEAVEWLRERTRSLGLAVFGSAFGRHPEGPPWTNRFHLVDRGRVLLTYDKVHLFSPTAEPASFAAGSAAPETVDAGWGRVSGVVCYDLRFAALLRTPFLEGAELLCVCAQWPRSRRSHWRALLAGRAVEHQAFVIGANRTGEDEVGRRRLRLEFPGASAVVGPDGTVRAEAGSREGLTFCDVDLAEVRSLRRQVPVRRDARSLGD